MAWRERLRIRRSCCQPIDSAPSTHRCHVPLRSGVRTVPPPPCPPNATGKNRVAAGAGPGKSGRSKRGRNSRPSLVRDRARVWHRGAWSAGAPRPEGGMRLDALNDLFHARAFALGLAFGGVAFLLTSMIGVVRRRRVPDAAGIAFAAAAWLGVRGAWGPELASGPVAFA